MEGYDVGPLLRAVPGGVRVSHALFRVPFSIALERVRNDHQRAEGAISRDEDWLAGTHDRFAAALTSAPEFRWAFNTAAASATRIAEVLATDLVADADPISP